MPAPGSFNCCRSSHDVGPTGWTSVHHNVVYILGQPSRCLSPKLECFVGVMVFESGFISDLMSTLWLRVT